MLIHNPIFTGSIQLNGTDISQISTVSSDSSSFASRITSTESTASAFILASGSFSDRTTNTEATASALVTASGSLSTRVTAAEATASAFITASGSLSARIASNEARTGSFATTGSNYFIGTQVITGSVYIANDLIVQGSSSLQNITASAVSIGTNTVILNTDSPAVRFAGISVRDSGSNSSVTSSIWYDSLNNRWIYQNESGSSYSGGMFISGPRNTGSLGDEAGMTSNYIAKGLGGDHIGPSIIFESGSTNIGINTSTPANLLTVDGVASAGKISIERDTVSTNTVIGYLDFTNNNAGTTYGRVLGGRNAAGDGYVALGTGVSTNLYALESGYVGIGTTNPYTRLDVAGSVSINGRPVIDNSSAELYIGGITGVSGKGTDVVALYTANTERMRITSTGNVGIGTTNPGNRLDVVENTSNTYGIIAARGNNRGGALELYNGSTITAAIYSLTTNDLLFYNGNYVERMRITNSGSVGIGTTSPAEKLVVTGAIMSTGGITGHGANRTTLSQEGGSGAYWQSYGTNTSTVGTFVLRQASSDFSIQRAVLSIDTSGAATFSSSSIATNYIASSGNNTTVFNSTAATTGWVQMALNNTGGSLICGIESSVAGTVATNSTAYATVLRNYTNTDFQIATNNTVRLTILNTGAATFASSVTATAGLTVGSLGSGSDAVITLATNASGSPRSIYYKASTATINFTQTGGADLMTLTNGGNLGIGTTSPTQGKLVVSNAGPSVIANRETSVGVNSSWNASDGSVTFFGNESNHPLAFTTNNTERMRITSGGHTKISSDGTYLAAGSYHEVRSANTTWTQVISNKSATPYGLLISYSAASPNVTGDNQFIWCEDSTQSKFIVWSSGNVVNRNNSYGAISDIKFKENISDATSKLSDLLKVKVRNYNLIGDSTKQLGVIAQELEEVFPNMVEVYKEKDSDETSKSVKYSVFVPMLIKSIQELSAKVAALEAQQ